MAIEKIDAYNHILVKAYFDEFRALGMGDGMVKRVSAVPMLHDLDTRFRIMDSFADQNYRQVLSLAGPPIEAFATPDRSPRLAMVANDGMAELCVRYPARFPGFIASLPMNNPEAAVCEIDRATDELGACALQIFSNVHDEPLDDPKYRPIFAAAARHDAVIFMHPARNASFPDYLSEKYSRYELWWSLGWPYETSVAMARIVYSGILDEFPALKIVTHHMGGMIPYFEGRMGPGMDQLGSRTAPEQVEQVKLKHQPMEYYKKFYADTALFGALSATRCGLDFFGVDHCLFASDSPFDPEGGSMYIRETIRVIGSLGLSEADQEKIYNGNARRLLKLK